jgi:hypothetical protein
MRFQRLFVFAVIAIALPTSVASAKNEPGYLVAGEAIVAFEGGQIAEWSVDVAGSPDSTAAIGTLEFHTFSPDLDIRLVGAVDCLSVVGSTAYFSGVLTESNRADIAVGTPFYSAVTDGGPAGADMMAPIYLNPGVTCSPPSFQPEFVATSGDLTIQFCEKLKQNGKCKVGDG